MILLAQLIVLIALAMLAAYVVFFTLVAIAVPIALVDNMLRRWRQRIASGYHRWRESVG